MVARPVVRFTVSLSGIAARAAPDFAAAAIVREIKSGGASDREIEHVGIIWWGVGGGGARCGVLDTMRRTVVTRRFATRSGGHDRQRPLRPGQLAARAPALESDRGRSASPRRARCAAGS